ncbi:MAG: alkaline phosphatase family protein [Gemmatimonadetes bacterium]|nr:alkaline phosphatase family protein [Gemmatimonadota bacterium]
MFPDATTTRVRRVVIVVLDGLRADAMSRFELFHLQRLALRGAFTFSARTVSPSVTACAMASLLTGASPERHGLQSDRFELPRPRGPVHPLPKVLAEHSLPASAFISGVPPILGGLAQRIAGVLGFGEARCTGRGAIEVLETARRTLDAQRRGLIVMHWPDADRAGHDHGWMSPEYAMAAHRMDDALGRLTKAIDLTDPATLLIALADHGGGGRVLAHHDSDHPLDTTIPIVMAGGAVEPGNLGSGVGLVDVPATALWALGIPLPDSYVGNPLRQAFLRVPMAA